MSTYLAARETAGRCEAGAGADPGDIGAAVDDLLAIYDHLLSDRGAP